MLYSNTPCIYSLYAWDTDDYLFMCVDHYRGIAGIALYSLFAVIFIYLFLLGFMFLYKLHRVMKDSKDSRKMELELENLIIKNTILYIAALLSTLFSYIIWFMDIFDLNFPVHLDALFNCFVISLNYQYNKKYYQCLCGVFNRFCYRVYANEHVQTVFRSKY